MLALSLEEVSAKVHASSCRWLCNTFMPGRCPACLYLPRLAFGLRGLDLPDAGVKNSFRSVPLLTLRRT